MNKLTTWIAAIAASALIAGPAAAVEVEGIYAGEKARATLSGGGCEKKDSGKSEIEVEVYGDGFGIDRAPFGDEDDNAGPNTGLWYGVIAIQEAVDLDGNGVFVVSQRGRDKAPKRAAFGMSEDFFGDLLQVMGQYVLDSCTDVGDFMGETCQIDQNTGSFGKQGETLSMKLKVRCMFVTTNDKKNTVKFRFESGRMNFVDMD